VAILVMAAFGVTTTSVQMKSDPPVQPKATDQKPAATDQKMSQNVEGTVKAVRGSTITLEDGTQLAIPGAQISAEYEERGGQKIATSLQIKG